MTFNFNFRNYLKLKTSDTTKKQMYEKRMLSEETMNKHKLSNSFKKVVSIGDFI